MNLSFRRLLITSGAFAALLVSNASANLLSDGSFENQALNTTAIASTTPTAFSSWKIATTSGTTEIRIADTTFDAGAYPDAVNGAVYVSINGGDTTAGVGFIYQDFTTVIGQSYTVSFSAGRSGTGAGTVGIKGDAYNVVSGATSGGSLGTTSSTRATSGFNAAASFNFTATGTTSRVSFADISTATASLDAFIDNVVVVSAVPEPSTYAAITGLAVLGVCFIRRRRSAA